MFGSVISTSTLSFESVLICTIASLFCGLIVALTAFIGSKHKPSSNVLLCLIILPAIVQSIIMLVNGNIGTGIAVAGAFGLVRFRSAQGSAKDIASIFLAMAAGLATGTGYIFYAVLFTSLIGFVIMIINFLQRRSVNEKTKKIRIEIPESLDYTNIFDDIFKKYTLSHEMMRVKTTNMGTLYELTYQITEIDFAKEKEMIDEIRCRNGNLTVLVEKIDRAYDEL